MTAKKSQSTLILDYLKRGNQLTSLEALNLFGCFRLASRISDLNMNGHQIHKKTIKVNGKMIAQYSLPPSEPTDLFPTSHSYIGEK